MIKLYSGFRINGREVSVPCEYCGTTVIEFLHDKEIAFGLADKQKQDLEELSAKIVGLAGPFSFKDEIALVCDRCRAKLPETKKERDLCDEWSKYYSPQNLAT